MEKLQAALAKARDQRSGQHDRAMVPGEQKTVATGDTSDLWESLTQIDLSPDVLVRHRIVAQQAVQASSCFDVLRTKTLLQMQEHGWKRLVITSPGAGSGKTTSACNLALGLGRQSNLRTMLFDFDLGAPSVHRCFGITRPQNFSAVLSGAVAFEDHALRVSKNVAVIVSPEPEADPTQLIMSDRMKYVLDQTQERYAPDIMIFDLPGILSGGDRARAFLKYADCALIIAMADLTRFNDLDACESELAENTNVLGIVMNGCNPRAMS